MQTTSNQNINQRLVHIYLEANPNPNSMKFVLNFMLLEDGDSIDFPNLDAAENSPLAQEIFGIPGVERVFYMSNFITVTKQADIEWLELQEKVKAVIKAYFEAGKSLMAKDFSFGNAISENDTEIEKKIKTILDEYIRPAVEQDGGAISFHSFDEGKVKVLLQGSCSGCPSSTITLKAGIENLLKRMVPEVTEVVAEGV